MVSDRRRRLEDIRDQLTEALTLADVSVKAQIAGQLRQTLKEIDELSSDEESPADDAAERIRLRLASSNTA